MFLIGRVVGLSVFLIALLSICYMISKSKNIKQMKNILILYLFILFLISFFYVPYQTSDAYRLMNILKNTYAPMSFSNLLNLLSKEILYTKNLYFFFISRLGNEHFLPAITSLIYYGVLFYMLVDYTKRNKISYNVVSKFLFYFMVIGQFIEVIAGIRSQLSFMLVALCIYRELIQKKSILSNIIIYLLAVGMHIAVIPLIVFRFLIFLFEKSEKRGSFILRIIFVSVLAGFALRYGQVFLNLTAESAESYLLQSRYSYFWEYVKTYANIFINLYVIFIFKKEASDSSKKENSNYLKLLLLFIVFDACFFFEYNIFHRFSYFTNIIMLPLYIATFEIISIKKEKNNNKKYMTKYELLYFIFLLFIFTITFTRGDLTALKFY